MKTIRILSLLTIVGGIIAFWLVPGINKAGNQTYTRRYEDTDAKVVPSQLVHSDTAKPGKPDEKIEVKKYKEESISSEATLGDIDAEKFSRAIQFEAEEVMIVEEVLEDTVENRVVVLTDTTMKTTIAKKID